MVDEATSFVRGMGGDVTGVSILQRAGSAVMGAESNLM